MGNSESDESMDNESLEHVPDIIRNDKTRCWEKYLYAVNEIRDAYSK